MGCIASLSLYYMMLCHQCDLLVSPLSTALYTWELCPGQKTLFLTFSFEIHGFHWAGIHCVVQVKQNFSAYRVKKSVMVLSKVFFQIFLNHTLHDFIDTLGPGRSGKEHPRYLLLDGEDWTHDFFLVLLLTSDCPWKRLRMEYQKSCNFYSFDTYKTTYNCPWP